MTTRLRSLRELRIMAGLSQAAAARMVGMDRTILCLIERGEADGNAAVIAKLRRRLVRVIERRANEIHAVLTAEHGGQSEARAD